MHDGRRHAHERARPVNEPVRRGFASGLPIGQARLPHTQLASEPALRAALLTQDVEDNQDGARVVVHHGTIFAHPRTIVKPFTKPDYDVPMSDETVPFGAWLQQQIDRKGWSLRDFASRVGVSHSTVSRWIQQGRQPETEQCASIAAALGVDPDLVLARARHRDARGSDAVLEANRILREENQRLRTDLDETTIRMEATPIGRDIPVVGRVPADTIRWTEDEGIEPVRILEEDLKGARLPVGLLVTGDCMRAIGILPGDVVVVDRNVDRDPLNGEIVVIRVNGEFTLKRWHREGNRIELRDGNDVLVHTLSPLDEYSIEAFYITYKPLAKR